MSSTGDDGELQRLGVGPEPPTDVEYARFEAELTRAHGATVCQVYETAFDGSERPIGSGFLVGPDLVLTNYHVVSERTDPSTLRFRFGRMNQLSGIRQEGESAGASTRSDWLVDWSPYAESEGPSGASAEPPTDEELDFALVRLDAAIGEHRGWIELPRQPLEVSAGAILGILQHPRGRPLSVAVGPASERLNVSATRYFYEVDTEAGSSGSPVFTSELELIGLHHAGTTTANRAVPAWRIAGREAVSRALPEPGSAARRPEVSGGGRGAAQDGEGSATRRDAKGGSAAPEETSDRRGLTGRAPVLALTGVVTIAALLAIADRCAPPPDPSTDPGPRDAAVPRAEKDGEPADREGEAESCAERLRRAEADQYPGAAVARLCETEFRARIDSCALRACERAQTLDPNGTFSGEELPYLIATYRVLGRNAEAEQQAERLLERVRDPYGGIFFASSRPGGGVRQSMTSAGALLPETHQAWWSQLRARLEPRLELPDDDAGWRDLEREFHGDALGLLRIAEAAFDEREYERAVRMAQLSRGYDPRGVWMSSAPRFVASHLRLGNLEAAQEMADDVVRHIERRTGYFMSDTPIRFVLNGMRPARAAVPPERLEQWNEFQRRVDAAIEARPPRDDP